MKMIKKLREQMGLLGESTEVYDLIPEDETYRDLLVLKLGELEDYMEFIESNRSVYFALYNPNVTILSEDYFTLYSVSEGKSVKDSHMDWEKDKELMVLGCIGQETYLFSYGKEVYAFPQHLEYEPENLIYIAVNLEELLTNKNVFNRAMKYSDLLLEHFDDEDDYERFLKK